LHRIGPVFGRARAVRAALGVILVACVHARGGAQPGGNEPPQQATAALAPGDRLRVTIWREPDLSREFLVPVDGVVDFPEIGTVTVVRLPVDSLTAVLRARYAVSLRDPSIEVTPLRRVRVFGAVRNPGYYYADPTVTVAGAVLLAGGVTPDGDARRVQLLRNGGRQTIVRAGGAFRGDLPAASGDQISVPERNWSSRNTGVLTAVVTSVVTAIALVVAAVVR
jgi:polysaccharide export outer membrane protein